jgi:hypothetical protein
LGWIWANCTLGITYGTWKSCTNGGLIGNIIYKWWFFNCHVWFSEGNYVCVNITSPGTCRFLQTVTWTVCMCPSDSVSHSPMVCWTPYGGFPKWASPKSSKSLYR